MPGVVRIFVNNGGEEKFIRAIEEAVIVRHSQVVRLGLAYTDPEAKFKKVILYNAKADSLAEVLNQIEQFGHQVKVRLGSYNLVQVVETWKSKEAIKVEPQQDHVMSHMIWLVSNTLISPKDMSAVHEVFGNNTDAESARLWDRMVSALAWNFWTEKFSEAENKKMIAESAKYPELDGAILAKIDEIRLKEDTYKAEKEQRIAHQEAKKRAWEYRQRKDERARERYEQRVHEEVNGLRPVSEHTLAYVGKTKADEGLPFKEARTKKGRLRL